MEIKTKFNIGDKTWTLIDGKAKETVVDSIHIYNDGVSYAVKDADRRGYIQHQEAQCFKTKDELIEYITSE